MPLMNQSTAAGPEDRAFLQQRVGLFGLMVGGSFLFFLAFRVAMATVQGDAGRLPGDPTIWYHLAASLIFIAVWILNRVGERSTSTIRTIETVGLIGASGAMVVMASYIPPVSRPDYILVLALTAALTGRALVVPSSARRSLTLSAVIGVQVVVAVYFVFLKVVPEHWEALIPEITSESQGEIAGYTAANAAAWWVLTTAVITGASGVVYGLRRDVRDAKQLGQYRLEHKIGEGGMGAVYRASHAMLRRPTAIKLLRPDRTGAGDLRRFEEEVQHTAQLSHPNIITIFDYGHTPEGVFYYAMEYLGGMTLAQVVEADGAQPVGRVVRFLEQVGAALVHAHGEGLIHRDIKPANVMVFLPHRHGGEREQVKLLDFGLVKELKDEGGIDLTHADTVSGTPQYMSPEMIRAPGSVDSRSDLYAVGAVAYYVLTGQQVFEGENLIEVCSHHLHSAPAPMSSRAPQAIPEELEQLVMSCLAKDPLDRPTSALDFLRALEVVPREDDWTSDAALQWWTQHGSDVANEVDATGPTEIRTIDVRGPLRT